MSGKLSIVVILFTVLCSTFGELNINAYKGETANIKCAYAAENNFNPKYFFKMSAGRNIKSLYSLKGRRFMHDGRVSMSDDIQGKVLQVSLDAVSESDSGLYACAVGKGHNLETFAVVRLSVMTAPQIQVNTVRSSVPTVRSILKHTERSNSVTVKESFTPTRSPATGMPIEKALTASDWRLIALYVGVSLMIVALLSGGLILLSCLKLRRRSLKNKRNRKSASKQTQLDQKTENLYNEPDVRNKRQDSIYQELNKKQSDRTYQCLNKNNFKN